jgi:hypothetical protein
MSGAFFVRSFLACAIAALGIWLAPSPGAAQVATPSPSAAPSPAVASSPTPAEVEGSDVNPLGLVRAWSLVGLYTGSSYAPGDLRATQIVLREAVARLGQSLLRATLPTMIDVQNGASGFGDAQVFYFFESPVRNGRFGIGPSISVPTASNAALGSGKWSIGPAAGYLVAAKKARIVSGFLMQSFFSVAGPSWRKPQSLVYFQPLLVHDLGAGWSLRSVDATWAFDMQRGSSIMPLSLGVGKMIHAGGQTFVVALSDIATVVHANAPRAPKNAVKLNISIVYPKAFPQPRS